MSENISHKPDQSVSSAEASTQEERGQVIGQKPAEADNDTALVHGDAGNVGVLLINLGTPDEPSVPALRRYLAEFLSDPRVIEWPRWIWLPILHAIVLNRRPKKIVPKYRLIWSERGSPLLVHSQDLADAVARFFTRKNLPVRVGLAMRYGKPGIIDGLQSLRTAGCDRILVVPLYPQYAASTTGTVVDAVNACLARMRHQPSLRFLHPFHAAPAYLDSMERFIREHWQQHGKPERLLLSFHGLPQSSVDKGDPYYQDCMQTTQALRDRLGADGERIYMSFQSRFGPEAWIQPYTEPTLEKWGKEGVGVVDVMCPGFVADCLETLEEIEIGGREVFLQAGGTELRYIPCLNADPAWATGFAELLEENLYAWL